ncbi:MAG: hypothetical protein KME64_41605 [Scytonematopsis contorta HA4267-MV1]|nr:hypothetical protein [Scytonematopsis contorta HA4267-MV1]
MRARTSYIPITTTLIAGWCAAGAPPERILALITKQINYQFDDIYLHVSSPIDWQSIPTEPKGYEEIFNLLFDKSSEQSIYQALLPSQLQLREFIQNWLMDETIANILNRLSNSKPIQVELAKLQDFLGK